MGDLLNIFAHDAEVGLEVFAEAPSHFAYAPQVCISGHLNSIQVC